jgi:hypothetical protein
VALYQTVCFLRSSCWFATFRKDMCTASQLFSALA